jgi:diguanylate cyclase (GGDEF)-like protein
MTITASIGISLYPDHGADIDTILKNADSAMYQAKQTGRNRFQLYNKA